MCDSNSSFQNGPELKSNVSYSTGCDTPWESSSGSVRTGGTQLLLPRMHRASCPSGMSVILLEGTGVATFIQTLQTCLPSPWSTLRAALRLPGGSHVQCGLVPSLWKGSVGVRGLSRCWGSGLYLCSFLTQWAEDTEGATVLARGGQTRHRAPW